MLHFSYPSLSYRFQNPWTFTCLWHRTCLSRPRNRKNEI